MLAVYRQQYCPARLHLLHEQSTGHDQRFLVGKQHALALANRFQGRHQTCGTDYARHNTIDLIHTGNAGQRLVTAQHLDIGGLVMQTAAQIVRGIRVGQHRILWLVRQALFEQALDIAVRGQRDHPVAVAVATDNVECA